MHVNASPSATKKKGEIGGADKNDKSIKSVDKKGTKRVLLLDKREEDAYKSADDDDQAPSREKRTKKIPGVSWEGDTTENSTSC